MSCRDILNTFYLRANLINLMLLTLSLPTMAVALYYIATSLRMILDRQRNEIALLKSRGASTSQILGIYWLEGILMGALALVIGPLVGLVLAQGDRTDLRILAIRSTASPDVADYSSGDGSMLPLALR